MDASGIATDLVAISYDDHLRYRGDYISSQFLLVFYEKSLSLTFA